LLDYLVNTVYGPVGLDAADFEVLEMERVGEASAAFSVVLNPADLPNAPDEAGMLGDLYMDILAFRRANVVAVVAVAQLGDTEPTVTVEGLAALWDARMAAALAGKPAAAAAPQAPAAEAAQVTAVVEAAHLNVRQGPGTGYTILTTVQAGDTLTVIDQANGCAWLNVITPGGIEGWVSGAAQYVRLEAECAAIGAAVPASQPAAPSVQPTEEVPAAPTDAPAEEPTPQPTPTPTADVVVVAATLNLRAGPGTNYAILDSTGPMAMPASCASKTARAAMGS
jgi:uncharacterized protein YraI